VGIDGVQYFLFGLLDVFYALLAMEILAVGTSGTGVLAASFGVGGLVGAGIAVGLAGRQRLATPMVVALVVCGASLSAIAAAGGFPVAVALLALCGAARSVFDAPPGRCCNARCGTRCWRVSSAWARPFR